METICPMHWCVCTPSLDFFHNNVLPVIWSVQILKYVTVLNLKVKPGFKTLTTVHLQSLWYTVLSDRVSVCICPLIPSSFSLLFTYSIPVLLILTPWPDFDDHTCQSVIILVKKKFAYFLIIVNLTRPPCLKTKSLLLISMSFSDKEYLYSRKSRLRSKVSVSEFYGLLA